MSEDDLGLGRRLLSDWYVNVLSRLIHPSTMSDPRYFDHWQSRGFHVTPVHFYEVVPDVRMLPERIWKERSAMVGVDLREEAQVALIQSLGREFGGEVEGLRRDLPDVGLDWLVLYAMVRRNRPGRVIEVGSGLSTRVIAAALERNRVEHGVESTLIAIEPHPAQFLVEGIPGLTELWQERVQDVPLAEFQKLGQNDLLFIDSSHVSKIGSDVNFEILEVLPRLSKGVLVHVHDIYLPYDYPKFWSKTRKVFWNEAYLLHAFLSFNDRYETVWTSYCTSQKHPEAIRSLDRTFDPADTPSSFWIRRVK